MSKTLEVRARAGTSFCLSALVFACVSLCLASHAAEPSLDDDPDLEVAARMERGFQKLAKRIAPSVVSLQVNVKPGSWMEELRRMGDQLNAPPSERQFEGSGVIIDASGLIVTNEHVVRGADRIRVKLADGRTFNADVCGTDPRSDLAMIRLVGDNLPKDIQCAVLADSDNVNVGQWAVAVGNPFGLSNTLTVGVVSARGRSMPVHNFSNDVFYGNLIQTDAAINPGNSGGPLFDLRGKLIGINTMIFSKTGVSQGFGFAIPSNHLQKRLAYLKNGREVEYGWLGVRLADLAPGQKMFKVPDDKGVLVDGVIPNTPADRAGLEQGMVILDFDGTRISSKEDLMGAVNETPVGHSVKVKALDRSGKVAEYNVRISKRSTELVRATARAGFTGVDPLELDEDDVDAKSKTLFSWRGMQIKELAAEDGRKRGGRLEITRVKKGSPADRAGLYEGAIITELKHAGNPAIQKFSTLDEFKMMINGIEGSAALYCPLDGYITLEAK